MDTDAEACDVFRGVWTDQLQRQVSDGLISTPQLLSELLHLLQESLDLDGRKAHIRPAAHQSSSFACERFAPSERGGESTDLGVRGVGGVFGAESVSAYVVVLNINHMGFIGDQSLVTVECCSFLVK